jgi:hypothetical protein
MDGKGGWRVEKACDLQCEPERRRFGTMTSDLRRLSAWLYGGGSIDVGIV